MKYGYACPTHGIIDADIPADSIACLQDGCGEVAKRVRAFAVDKVSLKSQARFDPIVGQYVRNEREFRSILAAGQDRTARELNMDVPLVTLDARDKEGLAELHGHSTAERDSVADQTKRRHHDDAVKA